MATTTTVGDTLTTVFEGRTGFSEIVGFKISNTGANLSDFQVQVRVSSDETEPWLSLPLSTDAATPWPFFATTNLTTLSSGGLASLFGVAGHFKNIRLQARVASGTTEVIIWDTSST
jgi:hypothetical protein